MVNQIKTEVNQVTEPLKKQEKITQKYLSDFYHVYRFIVCVK